jgi:hypothetical protein
MVEPVKAFLFLAAVCLMIGVAAGEQAASQPQTQPAGTLDSISLKAMDVFRIYEKSIELPNPGQYANGDYLAWSESYALLAYEAMYEATGEQGLLQKMLEQIDRILANRADRIGLTDEVRGKVMPAWPCSGYTRGKAHAFLVHAGMITYPMARLAYVLRRDPQLAVRYAPQIDKILTDVAETVRAYEAEYRDGPAEGEGYYYCPVLKADLPFNQQNALGRTMIAMYLASGDEWYRDRAEKLAQYFKDRLRLLDDRYAWDYWVHRPDSEDISHAAINVDFAFNCYRAGIVFNKTDMKRFVGTFEALAKPEGFAGAVDGSGRGGGVVLGAWGHLGYVEPRVRQMLGNYLPAHHRQHNLFSMLTAGFLVETQQAFKKDLPVTAATQPAKN